MKKNFALIFISILIGWSCATPMDETIGKTIVTKWKDNKNSAISITYDDGIINQFTIARPIMNKYGFPATFYVITGKIPHSGKGKFIGRPIEEIIAETGKIKTDKTNFFERASAIAFAGEEDGVGYHSGAGSLYERGKEEEAFALIDKGYEKLRNHEVLDTGEFIFHDNLVDTTTWTDLKSYANEGHEIASHTVTHARLAALDEANMLYELEQSKADIKEFLGEKYIFSAECPYGTENERVMEYAHKLYPALRNRMPEEYLEEINRASKMEPSSSDKEYIQWQRGPVNSVSMDVMKSWVDTCVVHDNIWLVLVFHGINGIGWEPRTDAELEEYFKYMKDKESDLWVATFADVTKYIRKRKEISINSVHEKNQINLTADSKLDPIIYDVPLTLKTYIPGSWEEPVLKKGDELVQLNAEKDEIGTFVLYNITSNDKSFSISNN